MRAIGISFGLALLALAGCGGERGAAGGGAGLPQVAMRNSNETVVPPGRGVRQMGLALRTFVPAGEGWNEIVGSRCQVTAGDLLRADVVTPVRLTLPDLGPDAPPLRADCTSGTLKGAAAVAPAFGWPAEGRPSAAHRIWWGAGWWWGFEKTGPMSYPDLAVAMR